MKVNWMYYVSREERQSCKYEKEQRGDSAGHTSILQILFCPIMKKTI